jgi:L-lactate utilization protein LutC
VSPGLFGHQQFGRFARASSLCGACKDACPVDIDLPKLLLRVRAGGVTLNSKQQEKVIPSQVGMAIKLYSWMATNPKRFTTGLKLAGNLSKLVSLQSGWLRLPGFTGWGYSKDLPSPSSKPFRARWGERQVVENKTRIIQDDQEDVVIQENQPPGQSPEVVNLIQRFSHELISLGGEFTLCESGELGKIISERLKQLGVKSILSWDEDELPVDVIKDLKSNGIYIIYEPDPDVMAGLSGAELAIADTGTVIVPLEKGKPHFVSLLPEYHIVILRADDIVENIYQALSNPNLKQVSMTTLISGPSRTADIEMTLTIGVHGPKLVSVFCIEE